MLHIKYLLRLDNVLSPQLKQDPLTALAIGSSIVGGLGNMFGQSSANETNIMLAREAREWQTKENQINRDWQESMWNKQNEYNTPKNQKQLLKEANFNPFVMSADGSRSVAGSAGSPSMVGAPDVPHVNPINPAGVALDTFGQLMPLIQQQQQIEANVQEQQAKTMETIYKTAFDAFSKGGVKAYNNVMQSMAPLLERIDWSSSPLERQLTESIRGQVLDNGRKELDNEFKQIENGWAQTLFADKHMLNSDEHKQFVRTLKKIQSEINNINAMTGKTRAEKDKIVAERVGVLIDNGLKGLDFEIKQDVKEDIIDEYKFNADKSGYDAISSYRTAKYGSAGKYAPFVKFTDSETPIGSPTDKKVYGRAVHRRGRSYEKGKKKELYR